MCIYASCARISSLWCFSKGISIIILWSDKHHLHPDNIAVWEFSENPHTNNPFHSFPIPSTSSPIWLNGHTDDQTHNNDWHDHYTTPIHHTSHPRWVPYSAPNSNMLCPSLHVELDWPLTPSHFPADLPHCYNHCLSVWQKPAPIHNTRMLRPTIHPYCQCCLMTINCHCVIEPPPTFLHVTCTAWPPTGPPFNPLPNSYNPPIHLTHSVPYIQWHPACEGSKWIAYYPYQHLPHPPAHSSLLYLHCHSYLSCQSWWHTWPATTLTCVPPSNGTHELKPPHHQLSLQIAPEPVWCHSAQNPTTLLVTICVFFCPKCESLPSRYMGDFTPIAAGSVRLKTAL